MTAAGSEFTEDTLSDVGLSADTRGVARKAAYSTYPSGVAAAMDPISTVVLKVLQWGVERLQHRQDRDQRRKEQATAIAEHRLALHTARRREIREHAIAYRDLVSATLSTYGSMSRDDWISRRDEVWKLWHAASNQMDLDRGTAGANWCSLVDECLFAGWKAVNHQISMEMFSSVARADGSVERLERLKEEFSRAYRRIVN